MANTISISYKVAGSNEGLKKLVMDVDGLRKLMTSTIVEADKLKESVFNLAATVTVIDSVNEACTSLLETCRDLTEVYAAQVEVETQLGVNMRNTMDAREEDIQSIKDLCAAQQELGVIGDEVQLAGAQEMATYLSQKSSLEQLIPVMNDMLAQQYGLNATQENAAQIAGMLGKVMEGQTGALSRYGYSFDDAQEKILKYGTEAERVAVLCEVISSSVGGMNAELAKTDVGKQKQLENTLGDIKEQLGGLAQGLMPMLTFGAYATTAAGGLVRFYKVTSSAVTAAYQFITAKKSLAVVSGLLAGRQKLLNVVMFMGTGSMKKATHAVALYNTGVKGSIAHTTALKIAMKGLLISTGIGLAIAALTSVISYFALKADDAADSLGNLSEAEEKARQEAEELDAVRRQESSTLANSRALLSINISALKEFNGTKEQEKKLVGEMNDTYGETMGYFSTVADWYKALVANSEEYCRQMVLEARTRRYADQIAQLETENENLVKDEHGKPRKYDTRNKTQEQVRVVRDSGGGRKVRVEVEIFGSSDQAQAIRKYEDNNRKIQELNRRMEEAAKEKAEISYSVQGSSTPPGSGSGASRPSSSSAASSGPVWTDDPQTLREYEDNISVLNGKLKDVDATGAVAINRQIKGFREAAEAIRRAGIEEEKVEKTLKEAPSTLREVNDNLSILRERLQDATSIDKAAEINAQIQAQEKLAESFRSAGIEAAKTVPEFDATVRTLSGIRDNISALTAELDEVSDLSRAAELNREIELWKEKADAITRAGEKGREWKEIMADGWGKVKGVEGGVRSLTEALQGNGDAWSTLTGIVDGFLQIYEGIRAVVELINEITSVTSLLTAGKTAEAAATTAAATAQGAEAATSEAAAAAQIPVIAANKAAAGSFMELAAASYFAAHASIPFAGFGIASGFVTSATAMVEAIGVMPFADGGIVSGPTVGLIGEYAGASSNPEVVAPLDKLRSMLKTTGEPVVVGGTFRISGRDLVGVLANETRVASKTGRKTNIKL